MSEKRRPSTSHRDPQAADWRPTRLRDTPSWLISQAATLSNRFAAAAYERVGATRHQYAVLTALGEIDGATQAELGRHCHIDRSDITGTIGELEHAGFIVREENAVDRRQKLVSLTPAGRERVAQISEALHAAQDHLLTDMSHEDRKTLARLLAGILDHHLPEAP